MYIVYNLLFTIKINIENYYYKTINTRWIYQIIRLHTFTQVQYLSFGKSLVYIYICMCVYIFIITRCIQYNFDSI